MSKHPLARLLGDGVIAGVTTWAVWRFLLKPMGRGVSHLGYRWRRFLTPLWLSLGIEITAIIWHRLAPWYWWLALALPVFGGTAAVLGPRLSTGWSRLALVLVPESMDGGRKGALDRVPERIYSAAVLSYLGLWLALRVGTGASALTTYGFWAGVIGFGGTWWYHRRIRTAGIADRYARSWKTLANPDTGPIKELHGSRCVEARGRGRNVAYLTVRLKGGLTVADLSNRLDQLCSFWSLRRGAITLSEDESNARRAYLQILRGDPWRHDIPHPLPEPGTVSLLGLRETIPMLGLLANGEQETMRTRHLQIIGKNGSGKTVLLEDLMIWISSFTDAQMVGADMASGATFAMWQPVMLLPVAINYEQTLELLRRVVAEIEYREAKLGVDKATGQANDSIVISPEEPALFCLVDELPKFVSHCQMLGAKGKEGIHLLNVIGQQGRKVRVWVIACAQNGSKANMATKELQAQMSTISFYLSEHASRVLWGADVRQGWSSSGLKNGQALLQDDEHTEPNVFKAVFATKAQRAAHIRKASAVPRPAGICPGLFAAVDPVEPVTVVDAPVTESKTDALDRLIIQTLCDRPQAHWKELAELGGVAKPTLYRSLKRLVNLGEIHSIGKGCYRIGRDPDMSQAA
ncbi:MAG TPA: hypothetical protein VGH72_33640 [Pseudonocardia sp.]|jgi:hypothetical protein